MCATGFGRSHQRRGCDHQRAPHRLALTRLAKTRHPARIHDHSRRAESISSQPELRRLWPVDQFTRSWRLRGEETAIGYRYLAEAGDPEKSFGVHLKPEKAEAIVLNEGDRVIVLASN
jgi:hypothetical protein